LTATLQAVVLSADPCQPLLLLLLLLQVFPTSGWAKLYTALNSSVAAGGPAYHLAEYTVMDNAFQAVHGGWQVRAV
jgi:hypothetical protein